MTVEWDGKSFLFELCRSYLAFPSVLGSMGGSICWGKRENPFVGVLSTGSTELYCYTVCGKVE